jgi:four helix bundle suffix protein
MFLANPSTGKPGMRKERTYKYNTMKKLRPSGGYRGAASFQTATLIYDATCLFCEKFVDSRSRMLDQMTQAARSGRQNIAEGSRASATSSQTELRLVNVARSSLEELLLDFEDYLRHRRLAQWALSSAELQAVREVPKRFRQERTDQSDMTDLSDAERWALYAPWLEHERAEVRANAIICLIHQTSYLLDRQIAALEEAFAEEGGHSEQPAASRTDSRERQSKEPQRQPTPAGATPSCPKCGRPMTLRTAKAGRNAGKPFWGCTGYPDCKEVVRV